MTNNFNNLINWQKCKYVNYIKGYHGVMLCCSGGADSTALLVDFIDFFKSKNIFKISIFHTNFLLRGEESEGDELFLRSLAVQFDIPIYVYRITQDDLNQKLGKSTQEWARDIRYRELKKFIDERWCIVFAHNKDDLAENILMRMSRGSSLSGLSGMQEWNPPFWRPMLKRRKKEVLQYLERKNLPFREDSSNAKIDYSRNRVRHIVLPELEQLYPNATHRIARIGQEAAELTEFVRKLFILDIDNREKRSIHLDKVKFYPDVVLKELIVFLCKDQRGEHRKLTSLFLKQVINMIRDEAKFGVFDLPQGGAIVKHNNFLSYENNRFLQKSKPSQKYKSILSPSSQKIYLLPSLICEINIVEFNKFLILENLKSDTLDLTIELNQSAETPKHAHTWSLLTNSSAQRSNDWMIGYVNKQKVFILSYSEFRFDPTLIKVNTDFEHKLHVVFIDKEISKNT